MQVQVQVQVQRPPASERTRGSSARKTLPFDGTGGVKYGGQVKKESKPRTKHKTPFVSTNGQRNERPNRKPAAPASLEAVPSLDLTFLPSPVRWH
jgi:hypothetical protein